MDRWLVNLASDNGAWIGRVYRAMPVVVNDGFTLDVEPKTLKRRP